MARSAVIKMKRYVERIKSNSRQVVVLVGLLLLVSGSADAASKRIAVLVWDGVLTSDVTAPIEVFGAASRKAWFSSYEVMVVSAGQNKTVTTEEGLRIVADATIADMKKEVDVLIVPSAYDMKPLLKNTGLVQFIGATAKRVSWLASNCSGAFLLAETGMLDGKKATTWAGGEKELQVAYPKVKVQVDQNVVVDGNIMTSNGGVVSYQAALLLLEKLSSHQLMNEVADAIQYGRVRQGSLSTTR